MPTVWPILFAAIFGDAIKWFAYWRLERGIKLQPLDRLLSSQTLGSTLVTIIIHRSVGLVASFLLAIWSLSPLGSQAVLRVLTVETPTAAAIGNLSYADPGLAELWDGTGPFCCESGSDERFRTIIGVYNSALFRPDIATQYNKKSQQYNRAISMLGGPERAGRDLALDAWGNIRIPALHRLDGYDPLEPDKWIDIPPDQPQVLNYSSLIGLSYRGIPSDFIGNTTMTVNQSYHRFQCSPWVIEHPDQHPDRRSPWLDKHYPTITSFAFNKSLTSYFDIMKDGLHGKGSTYFFAATPGPFKFDTTTQPGNPKIPLDQRHLLLGSRGRLDTNDTDSILSFTSSAIKTEYIQASISCRSFGTSNKRICAVDRMRRNPSPLYPELVTAFESSTLASHFSMRWPGALEGGYHAQSATLTETFLLDPATKLGNGDSVKLALPVLSKLPVDVFEDRLGLLVNTFFRATTRYSSTLGLIEDLFNETLPADVLEAGTHRVEGEMSYFTSPIYVLSTTWMVIYFVSASMLAVAAVAAFFLRFSCRAPEVLGSVVSMTRDSEFFQDVVRGESSTRAGSEVSKELARSSVMLGDVWGDRSVGRIALMPAGMGQRVKVNRLYE
ncbi:hypothetical protein QBC34DRAFT_494943 [Podospora aff. communis PSN243]|uniref:Uncharacterized protein n=1 Tax=Podospora aff. communis PSN243 TaxID=3040156 RepID=A0AAV9GK20_9PEZI|nr:hypothetical protein QBC34DRAFT_494943 [Podospora aff. communis PSN243]